MLKLDRVQDLETLRQAALILERENEKLVEKNLELQRKLLEAEGADPGELQLKLEELQQQLSVKNRLLFGASSEKRPAPGKTSEARTPQTGHGPREQKSLPIEEVVHDLDAADKACVKCGGALAEMDGQFEESEEVHVLERTFVLRKHKRKKYRCGCGAHVETALGPTKLIAGGRYSPEFAIEVAVAKYLDHAPLERQVRTMGREGLVVDSQTLWNQIEALARVLAAAHERLHKHVLLNPVIGADETHWPMLGAPDGEKKRWQAWTVAGPDAVCYRIQDSRSAEAGREILVDFAGVVMADGYSAYVSLAKNGGRFRLAHCWAHVRRKFIEVEPVMPIATEMLDMIGELYAIEQSCPTGPPGDEMRRQLRTTKSREVVGRIQRWLLDTRALPQSGLGKAIAYASGMWNGLVRFLDDPRIPIDNNATERAMRGPVIGRKNHYGSKSRRGTEVAALFYSLLESAKLVDVDPKEYLRRAIDAGLRGEQIPLPHELRA